MKKQILMVTVLVGMLVPNTTLPKPPSTFENLKNVGKGATQGLKDGLTDAGARKPKTLREKLAAKERAASNFLHRKTDGAVGTKSTGRAVKRNLNAASDAAAKGMADLQSRGGDLLDTITDKGTKAKKAVTSKAKSAFETFRKSFKFAKNWFKDKVGIASVKEKLELELSRAKTADQVAKIEEEIEGASNSVNSTDRKHTFEHVEGVERQTYTHREVKTTGESRAQGETRIKLKKDFSKLKAEATAKKLKLRADKVMQGQQAEADATGKTSAGVREESAATKRARERLANSKAGKGYVDSPGDSGIDDPPSGGESHHEVPVAKEPAPKRGFLERRRQKAEEARRAEEVKRAEKHRTKAREVRRRA